MIYIFITFIAFSILLIAKNHRSRNIIWFCFMLVGFCLAFVGLAYYSQYMSNYSEDKLFGSVSGFIWTFAYYLNLDISKGCRIMNIGTSLYIYGAICFPLSYITNRRIKRAGFIVSILILVLLLIIYDPYIINMIYGLNESRAYALANKHISGTYQILNIIFNRVIKLFLIISIGIFIFVYRTIIPIIRKKFMYMIIGIVPIHILFLVLFYWFPNHSIAYRRYYMLSSISAPYNGLLYGFIMYFGIFSVILLIYAMWRYNIFDINVRKSRINFQKQMDTAHVGLKVFSHTIKNQMIAIKLLAEQIENTSDDSRKNMMVKEIADICNDSIVRLGASFKKTEIVKLRYENVHVNELIRKVISRHEKICKDVLFLMDIRVELFLFIDRMQFEKVMDNLLINAIEACSECAKPFIKISIGEKDVYGIITIEDNGSGIESKNIKKVFDPFFSTKPMSTNWGIGLSQCQKTIEAFGGIIEIESRENEGTKIHIFIPKDRR